MKRADGLDVVRSDFWTYDAPRATVGGSDSRVVKVKVGDRVDRLAVALAHPSLGTVGANLSSYTVTVTNAKGKVVGTTTESLTAGSGTATAVIRLGKVGSGPGVYSFAISGDYAASDPDTLDSDSVLGRMVTLQVAQLHGDERRSPPLAGRPAGRVPVPPLVQTGGARRERQGYDGPGDRVRGGGTDHLVAAGTAKRLRRGRSRDAPYDVAPRRWKGSTLSLRASLLCVRAAVPRGRFGYASPSR